MIIISKICLALTLSLAFASISMAEVQTRKIPVLSQILDDHGNPAEDISGIACLNGLGPSPVCLLINDEDREGQLARFGSDGISPTARFKLLTKSTQASALGSPPSENKCPAGGDSFDDLDGEAVAADSAKKVFYVAASHGCSRKKGKFPISSFLLARVAMTNSGDAATVDTTYRLSDALNRGDLAPFFAHALKEQNGDSDASGLNIEGIAVHGSRMYVGLRAPLIGGKAVIVVANVDNLFKDGKERLAGPFTEPMLVSLGSHAGIRDLAALPDGRLLILSGPTLNQAIGSQVFLFDPEKPEEIPNPVAAIDGSLGKPEAILYISHDKSNLKFLVLSDSSPNGSPVEYSVSIGPKNLR